MKTKDNVKMIVCPIHPTLHKAELFIAPHSLAGTWGCPVTNESDEHDHFNSDTITEFHEIWPTSDNDSVYIEEVELCADCGVPVNE